MAEALPSSELPHRRRFADRIAAFLAVLGTAILLAAALTATLSVVLRMTVNGQVRGDFEVLSVGSGLAILLFFPYCQSNRAHVVIGIFTDWLPARLLRRVDAFWSLVLAACAALLCWRLWLGYIETLHNDDITAMLHIPLFVVSLAALAGVAGTAVLAALDVAELLRRPAVAGSPRNEA